MKLYLPAGISMGLTLGLLISRGSGVLLLMTLGAALGWLLSLVTRPEHPEPEPTEPGYSVTPTHT